MKPKYCPECQDTVSDEECPHWDYENDPRELDYRETPSGVAR